MNLSDLASVGDLLGGLAAVGALAFAAVEIPRGRRQRLDDQAQEIAAVGLELKPIIRPLDTDFRGEMGDFVYDITIDNPGRYPISDVIIDLNFPGEAGRVHGTGAIDEACTGMRLVAPVVLSRDRRTWHRRLRVSRATSDIMHTTTARVGFARIDVGRITIDWPSRDEPFNPPSRCGNNSANMGSLSSQPGSTGRHKLPSVMVKPHQTTQELTTTQLRSGPTAAQFTSGTEPPWV